MHACKQTEMWDEARFAYSLELDRVVGGGLNQQIVKSLDEILLQKRQRRFRNNMKDPHPRLRRKK